MNIPPAKSKLLHEATSLFANHGFHGVSVRDISRKAGVNVSLVSRYFNGKQGLYDACILHLYEKMDAQAPLMVPHLQQADITLLTQQIFTFAQENRQTLLLIQRQILFEGNVEASQRFFKRFVCKLAPFLPRQNVSSLMLNIQSLLFLITRYALLDEKHIELLGSKSAIIDHLTQFIRHHFYQDHHESS